MTHFVKFRRSGEYIPFVMPEIDFGGNAFMPSTAIVPLVQHSGIPATPIISRGDTVTEGQLIARGNGPESCHVHSPIPGIVRDFRRVPLPDGTIGNVAIIHLAGSFSISGRKEENYPWQNISELEILRVIEEKGVVNTFESPLPLAPQARNAARSRKAILVVRLFDNDPTCMLDSYLVKSFLAAILEGAAILAKGIDATAVYLVTSGKKKNVLAGSELERLFTKTTPKVIHGSDLYPSGNLSQFRALLGHYETDLPSLEPVFIEPATAISVYEAVVKNQPVIHRYILLAGPAIDRPTLLKVKIGTPIGDIIEECGGFRTTPERIIVNGLLSGTAIYDLDTPVTKYTKSLHLMDKETCPDYTVRNCIHCGRCLQVCPVSIDPMRIVNSIQRDRLLPAVRKAVHDCQNCGCCAIVCPARIPLHHIIREAAMQLKGEAK